MFQIHGQYINETDFCDYTFDLINKAGEGETLNTIFKEIDIREESKEQYDKFIEHYINLYYSPRVEDYEEMKYFTRDCDKKMHKLINGRKLSSIKIKE
jgi:hypothetical protein